MRSKNTYRPRKNDTMSIGSDFITDYEENREDIERWFSIKCPQKYRRFSQLLESNGEEPTWNKVKDLYRYDKRLIFNSFRYVSFLEEYLRAMVVRSEGNTEESYGRWQEKYLSDLIKPVSVIMGSEYGKNLSKVKELRNCISHNRIVLESDFKGIFDSLLRCLPETYRMGFVKDMTSAANGLGVNEKWIWHPTIIT